MKKDKIFPRRFENEPNTGLLLDEAIKNLMNSSSGNVEEVVRDALLGIAQYLQNSASPHYDHGGLTSAEGFGKAAAQEYQDLFDWRAEGEARRIARESDPNRYRKSIEHSLVMRSLRGEITREEMYRLNDERLAAEEAAKVPAVCSECQGQRYIHNVCDQGHYGHSTPCEKCNKGGK